MAHRRFFCCLLVGLLAIVASADPAWAENEPIVIVVHGIGGGNRPDCWSDDAARAYGTDVREITFRYDGRGVPDSFRDYRSHNLEGATNVEVKNKDNYATQDG